MSFFQTYENLVVYKVTIRFAFFEIIVAAINYCLVKKNQIIYFGVIFEYFSIYLYMLFFLRRLIKSKNDYNYLVLCPHVGNHVKDTGNSIS